MNLASLDCKISYANQNLDHQNWQPTSALPDQGLATKQMLGKKSNKFCITVCIMCNADGSEKWPIFYIGKSKNPHCFKKQLPNAHGFYYRNNKTAWMTAAFFEE